MPEQKPATPSAWDQLITRPADPLPNVLEPDSPEARGAPADPKPVHPKHSREPVDEKSLGDMERPA